MKFVIVGLGSIGKRHKQNLEQLGHEVIPCHQNDNLKKILIDQKPAGVLICNPTSLHLPPVKIAAGLNLPIFIEKPLSHNLDGADSLKGTILIGYCLRFDQSLLTFKEQADKLDKAKIKSVKIVCQSWLPNWHPNIDYRQSYSAKKDLGGGVLLDLSHEIDYALWFFGPVKKVSAKLQMVPELQIETEAVADLELEFVSGVKASIHLSYASHEVRRGCTIITDNQTLNWDYRPNNEIYLTEMKHFINICQGKAEPLISLADGCQVLEVVETAKKGIK